MKIPVTITLAVLAAAATIGWHQRDALVQLRAEEQSLADNTPYLTDSATSGGSGSHTPPPRKSRDEREAAARIAAGDLIAALKEARKSVMVEPGRDREKRVETVLDRMYHMTGLEPRVLIEQLRNTPDLESPGRQHVISSAITSLAETDPAAAISILTDVSGPLRDQSWGPYDEVLGKWATSDPLAAIDWVRKQFAATHMMMGSDAFVIGLAAKDPKLAFQSVAECHTYSLHGDGEFEGRPNFRVAAQIARTARSLDNRTVMLGILRELADSPGDDPDNIKGLIIQNALPAMAEGLATHGFERASAWLDSLHLRPAEAAQLMQGLDTSEAASKGDAGKWFEWMGENLASNEFESAAYQKIDGWVRDDYQAVEKWLTKAADGPAKLMVVAAYASRLAYHDPANAARWAMTLPQGSKRDRVLGEVREQWQKANPPPRTREHSRPGGEE